MIPQRQHQQHQRKKNMFAFCVCVVCVAPCPVLVHKIHSSKNVADEKNEDVLTTLFNYSICEYIHGVLGAHSEHWTRNQKRIVWKILSSQSANRKANVSNYFMTDFFFFAQLLLPNAKFVTFNEGVKMAVPKAKLLLRICMYEFL